MNALPRAFVAYPSSNPVHAKAIFNTVRRANALPLPYKLEPWEFNDIAGRPLISPIIENIETSPFVFADITYLNPNVIYEIGYAMGRERRVILFKSSTIEGDHNLAIQVGIFDTLGYNTFQDEQSLVDILAAHHDSKPFFLTKKLDRKAPVYIVEPRVVSQIDVIITSQIKKAGFKYRSFMPAE